MTSTTNKTKIIKLNKNGNQMVWEWTTINAQVQATGLGGRVGLVHKLGSSMARVALMPRSGMYMLFLNEQRHVKMLARPRALQQVLEGGGGTAVPAVADFLQSINSSWLIPQIPSPETTDTAAKRTISAATMARFVEVAFIFGR